MLRKRLRLVIVIAMLLIVNIKPAKATKTVITWFIGLGTGLDEKQIQVEFAVARRFNESQNSIDLRLNIANGHQLPANVLGSLIASGNAPDIVGPVGFSGANLFPNQWLDLQPLVMKYQYDLKQFPKTIVNLYREDGALVGIPFAIFPSVMFYNVELFDKAKLPYPPAKFGEKYLLDGKEVDWNWDTVATIAKRLTLDENGKDANDSQFDPDKIVQFGYTEQWGTARREFASFGADQFWNPATGKVTIPESWREEAKWTYNGLWKAHFIPNTDYENSDLLKPHAFASGKVAMVHVPSWYTCCLAEMKAKWDLAVVPTYKGMVYVPIDADTFRIHKDSKNPDAAFKVLSYLLNDAAQDLLVAYSAYPARPDLQKKNLIYNADKYSFVQHWDVVPASAPYAVSPNHESNYPGFNVGQLRFADFYTLLYSQDIDVDKELDKLQTDLQKIIDHPPTPYYNR